MSLFSWVLLGLLLKNLLLGFDFKQQLQHFVVDFQFGFVLVDRYVRLQTLDLLIIISKIYIYVLFQFMDGYSVEDLKIKFSIMISLTCF